MDKIKKLALSLCFIIILSIVLSRLAFILERKTSIERYSKFWENPEEYDVWFMGTSHAYYAIQPMELWNQFGIRSYNLAAPSNYLSQTYWTMMCALQYSQPEVLVLDIYKVHYNTKRQESGVGTIHTGFDSIPLSAVKLKGIYDLFDTWEDRFEYICKFSVYHNRWEELEEKDFNFQPSITKGGYYKSKIIDETKYPRTTLEKISRADTPGFIYLKKIIEECQKHKIDLILVELPFYSNEEEQCAANAVPKLAEEYNITFLDLTDEHFIDYGMDFADRHHVNIFGAKKITEYLGNYLDQHYNLKNYTDEYTEVAEKWNAEYESYLQLMSEKLCRASKIKFYVQWLKDDRYTCYMYKKKDPEGLLAKEIDQLENITYISLDEAENRMGGKINGEYAFFVEDSNGKFVDKAVFKNEKRQPH